MVAKNKKRKVYKKVKDRVKMNEILDIIASLATIGGFIATLYMCSRGNY
ncbi:MAG: hypothetical protein Ta2F_01520 [Termitinemataceae bacterium]|nr:MAG: hypothetical protein Ta2F_01520 [Termitinemataceae bacterium]